MKNWVILSLGMVSLLTACGKNKSEVNLTLALNPVKNSISGKSATAPQQIQLAASGATCLQKDVYLAYKVGNSAAGQNDNSQIQLVFAKMRTPLVTSVGYLNDSDIDQYLQQSVLFDQPPVITAPRDQALEVGILGSLVEPNLVDANGFCATYDAAATTVFNNFSLVGHKKVTAQVDSTLPLNIWAVMSRQTNFSLSMLYCDPAVEAARLSNNSNSGNDNSDDNQICPRKDFVLVQANQSFNASGGGLPTPVIQAFRYLNGPNGQIVQNIGNGGFFAGSSLNLILPNLFPITSTYYLQGSSTAVTQTFPEPSSSGPTTASGTAVTEDPYIFTEF